MANTLKDRSIVELKAIVYDLLTQQNVLNSNLQLVEKEIQAKNEELQKQRELENQIAKTPVKDEVAE